MILDPRHGHGQQMCSPFWLVSGIRHGIYTIITAGRQCIGWVMSCPDGTLTHPTGRSPSGIGHGAAPESRWCPPLSTNSLLHERAWWAASPLGPELLIPLVRGSNPRHHSADLGHTPECRHPSSTTEPVAFPHRGSSRRELRASDPRQHQTMDDHAFASLAFPSAQTLGPWRDSCTSATLPAALSGWRSRVGVGRGAAKQGGLAWRPNPTLTLGYGSATTSIQVVSTSAPSGATAKAESVTSTAC